MKALHTVASVLVWVGGLNWGLVGAGGWNVVNMLLGSVSWLERLVYVLVGLSALYLVFTHKKSCKECCGSDAPAAQM